jgi:hypothetical protein
MAFSYSDNLTTPLYRVRHMLGDVTEPGYRSDETILALLDDYAENETVMILADSLANEFAMRPSNMSSPDGSMTWGDRVKRLQELSTRLRLEVQEGVLEAAQDKLRSFAPVRAGMVYETTEYYRPPIFFDTKGQFFPEID